MTPHHRLGIVVAFLGALASQVSSAQGFWAQATPTASPSGRYGFGLAYDSLHQQVVLFGGETGGNDFTGVGDTWVWDGSNWTQKTPATSPPARGETAMAYDSLHQQVVLFGGRTPSGTYLNDTWVWDGVTWTQKFPATSPSARDYHTLVYDELHQQAMLFGGVGTGIVGDTWVWDGTNWTQKFPATSPSPRIYHTAAYDAARQNVLLVAGYNLTGILSDAWTWDGTNWIQASPATSPSIRVEPALGYDPVQQKVILFGGDSAAGLGILNDTWAWDGANWTQLSTSTSPTPRAQSEMVFDTAQQRVVLFGGAGTLNYFNETWLFEGGVSNPTVNITVPAGVQFSFDGVTYTGSQAISIAPGSYTLSTSLLQTVSPGTLESFVSWSDGGGRFHTVVVGSSNVSITGTFQTQYQLTVNVPAGIQFTLSGFPYTGPQTVPLPSGTYSLGLNSPQATGAGTQSAFVSWSDGGAQSHGLILGAAPLTVTGTFKTQYLLTVNVSPSGSGAVSPATGYYDAGSAVVPVATPNSGFDFEYWSGACTGSNPFCLVILSGPMTLTANFATSPKWVPVFPSSSPSPRLNSEMAYDSARGVIVTFGGYTSANQITNDTWEWNGTTWNLRTPATSPPAREFAALAYDPIHHQTVLFGGVNPFDTRLADTWVWDGTTWTQKAGGPPARSSTRLAFDAPRNQILMFGGAANDTTSMGDTWAWNGTSWTQLFPAVSPSSRAGQGMVYDEARQQILLFGGINEVSPSTTLLNDTWVWNGSWTKLSPVDAPEVRDQMAIAFDGVAQQVVLFGGGGADFSNITWFWDGVNWTKKTYLICPTDRLNSAAAYDAARQQLVLFAGFGGGLLSPNAYLNDTWIFSNNLNPPQYPLTTSAIPAGEGTVAQYAAGQPGPTYYAGSPVLATATPNMGYELQNWSGACAGAGTCIAIAGQSVTANFGPARTWAELFPSTVPATIGGEFGAMAYDKARNQTVLVDEKSSTYTFDGINWTLRNPPTNLNSNLKQLVYDETNSQIVAVGGSGVFETWVWDGTTWTQKFPATQPPARDSFGLAYDGAIGKVVLFGGENGSDLNDTWLWDGSAGTWTQALPTHVPGVRAAPSMAYDTVRQVVLLFGGLSVTGAVVSDLSDTWVFNGSDWMQQSPSTPPTARNCAAMAWDEMHQQMVLFAGTPTSLGTGTVLADTWIWDGMNWAQRTPILSPPGRACSVMTYDALHQVPVLFGGFGAGLTTINDTWIYGGLSSSSTFTLTTAAAGNGTVGQFAHPQTGPAYLSGTPVLVIATPSAGYEFEYWSGACTGSSPVCTVLMNGNLTVTANFGVPEKWVQLSPASSPIPTPGTSTENLSMAYDQARQQIVFFGGPYGGSAYGNQTWVWDGATWTQKFPATVPPGRYSPGLAYDGIHQQVVMFGGATATAILSDTWVWDGTNWTQKAVGMPGPAGRINHGMAFDGQEILLFGGWDEDFAGFVVYGDTWAWDGNSWTQKMPAVHPGPRSDFGMAYDATRNQVVVFSGFDAGANDTWLWNGPSSTWTKASPVSSPPAGWNVMAFDSLRQQTIMVTEPYYTGSGATQTWFWDGAIWTQKVLAVQPSSRFAAAMAFDAAHQQMILFGGENAALLGDTWSLLAPSVNLVTQTPVLSKNASGYDLVTVSLKNQGNVPLTSISLTGYKVGSVTGIPITSTTLTSISPGSTASFTVEVPTASLPGTTTSLSFQGVYSTATATNAPWTISIRSVNLP